MCARFTLATLDVEALAKELAAEVERAALADPALGRPRYNAAPTQACLVLRREGGRRLLGPARFGLARRDGGVLVNVRSERVGHPGPGRARGACVVPVDGFYEWLGARGGRQPFWFHPPGGGPLLLAAVCEERDGARGFAILTTAANAEVRAVHDRMPAVLDRAAADRWIEQADPSVLRPAPDGALIARAVSRQVNSAEHEGPELLDPPEPDRQLGLL
jgi:putative SOS response-associated peptidase YedK